MLANVQLRCVRQISSCAGNVPLNRMLHRALFLLVRTRALFHNSVSKQLLTGCVQEAGRHRLHLVAIE